MVLHVPRTEQVIEKAERNSVEENTGNEENRFDRSHGCHDFTELATMWEVDSRRRVSPPQNDCKHCLQVRKGGDV